MKIWRANVTLLGWSLERVFMGILLFGVVTLLLLSLSSDVPANALSLPLKKTPAIASTSSLSQVYKEISSKALEIGEEWPDSTNADILFQRDDRGAYLIPSFPEQDAPLSVVAILDRNQDAHRIVKECDVIFASLVADLHAKLLSNAVEDPQDRNSIGDSSRLGEELERYTWRMAEGTHHLTVAVFQEHPSLLLDKAGKARWHRVEESAAEAVYHHISSYQPTDINLSSPRLQLDSILLTRDGAMIAGFLDMTGTFQNIRYSCLEIASAVLGGDGTSRPKNLIHVTMGRILALPQDLNPAQRQAVASLVRQYNTKILPNRVARMQTSLPAGASFALTELTMIRDVVWTLRRIKEYGSWHLNT